MKKFKRFLPLLLFVIVLVVGIIMFLTNKNVNLFSQQNFLILSLLVVGGIGAIASLFITLFAKPINSYKQEDSYTSLSNTIKSELNKLTEQNRQFNEEIKEQKVEEIKHKKVKCSYCKCKFDSSLSRCPSCGAPPESED